MIQKSFAIKYFSFYHKGFSLLLLTQQQYSIFYSPKLKINKAINNYLIYSIHSLNVLLILSFYCFCCFLSYFNSIIIKFIIINIIIISAVFVSLYAQLLYRLPLSISSSSFFHSHLMNEFH